MLLSSPLTFCDLSFVVTTFFSSCFDFSCVLGLFSYLAMILFAFLRPFFHLAMNLLMFFDLFLIFLWPFLHPVTLWLSFPILQWAFCVDRTFFILPVTLQPFFLSFSDLLLHLRTVSTTILPTKYPSWPFSYLAVTFFLSHHDLFCVLWPFSILHWPFIAL